MGRVTRFQPSAWSDACRHPGRSGAAVRCGSPACCLVRELPPLGSVKDYAELTEREGLETSYEDTPRGISGGSNHSTPEVTTDTGREQQAQVGRQEAPAIARSTGLRRRERRFESCRGHHA
jgi:hypothetical protein